jgi:heme A synthase
LNWNKWIRQIHRWLSIAFTVAVVANMIAIAEKKYSNGLGLMAVAPLAFLFLSGLYLFGLPYVSKWRRGRAAAEAARPQQSGQSAS